MLRKELLCVHACLWLWIGLLSPTLAQSSGAGAAPPQANPVNRPDVEPPTVGPQIQQEQAEAQSRADYLAFFQWRRRVDATTIPKLLAEATELRIYQDPPSRNEPLAVLSENSHPHIFHLLKQCSAVRRDVAQPLSSCCISLYKNGILLGNLTLFTEDGTVGAGRSWTVVPAEFMAWLRALKGFNGFLSPLPPSISPYSVPYRKGHMSVRSKRVGNETIVYGASQTEAVEAHKQ